MKKYKRVWVGKLFIYADTITEAKEVANQIDDYQEDGAYASVDSEDLTFDGKVKIAG